jgi:trypsin
MSAAHLLHEETVCSKRRLTCPAPCLVLALVLIPSPGLATVVAPQTTQIATPDIGRSGYQRAPTFRSDPASTRATEQIRIAQLPGGALPDGGEIFEIDGMATVYVEVVGKEICSGVVVGFDRVLTAAHCFDKCFTTCLTQIRYGPKIESPHIVRVIAYHRHPEYSAVGTMATPGKDFAVLILARHTPDHPARRQAARILVAHSFLLMQPPQLTVVGFGISSLADGRFGEVLSAEVSLATSTCSQSWALAVGCAPFQEFILANAPPDIHDTCRGDSGGPALLFERVPRVLVGITSRGLTLAGNPQECGTGGIYGLVGTIPNLKWLQSLVPDLRIITVQGLIEEERRGRTRKNAQRVQ